MIQRSHGMVLVTGPTGSGKTTTLTLPWGAMLRFNIVTIEDLTEYRLRGVNRQINTKAGLPLPGPASICARSRHYYGGGNTGWGNS